MTASWKAVCREFILYDLTKEAQGKKQKRDLHRNKTTSCETVCPESHFVSCKQISEKEKNGTAIYSLPRISFCAIWRNRKGKKKETCTGIFSAKWPRAARQSAENLLLWSAHMKAPSLLVGVSHDRTITFRELPPSASWISPCFEPKQEIRITFLMGVCEMTTLLLHSLLPRRGGGLGSRPIFKKFHETYAPS